MVDEKEQDLDIASLTDDINIDDNKQSNSLDSLFDDISSLENTNEVSEISFDKKEENDDFDILGADSEDIDFSLDADEEELLRNANVYSSGGYGDDSADAEEDVIPKTAALIIDELPLQTDDLMEEVQISEDDKGFDSFSIEEIENQEADGFIKDEVEEVTAEELPSSSSISGVSTVASSMSVLDEGIAKPQKPYDYEEKLKINLKWYSGEIGDKHYEVSHDNMPEFLDPNKNIKSIHINVESAYGWNVFFDNGVFMNLLDLKEYQERHAKIPCSGGKIIYGNKTTTFDQIEKIVVYVKSKYFSYEVR